MRAVAALMVLVFHAALASGVAELGEVFRHFDVGVAVFFTLSGFLLYRPMLAADVGLAPRTPVGRYYWRRFLRIVPAYWVALIVLFPILTYTAGGAVNAAFLQVYRTDWVLTGIGPAWSLCVEVAFYLALPLYAALAHRLLGGRGHRYRNELLLLGIATLAALALREYLLRADSAHPYALMMPPTMFPWFAVGMALAIASTGRAAVVRRLSAPLCWGAALAIYLVTQTTVEAGVIGRVTFICYALIAGLLIAPLVFGDSPIAAFLGRPALAWLGLVSYGVFLYHQPLMTLIGREVPGAGTGRTVLMFAVVVPAIACGAASHYLIERPALRLKHLRLGSRLRRRPLTAEGESRALCASVLAHRAVLRPV